MIVNEIKKVNNTDRQPVPQYTFDGTNEQYIEIGRRLEKHFKFLKLLGADPDLLFSVFDWKITKSNLELEAYNMQFELLPCGSLELKTYFALAVLDKFNDLPDFVNKENNF